MKIFFIAIYIAALPFMSFGQKSSSYATVKGDGVILQNGDSVRLILYPYGKSIEVPGALSITKTTVIKNKSFSFKIPGESLRPIEFSLIVPGYRKPVDLLGLLLRSGDKIHFLFNSDISSTLDGQGSEKNIAKRKIDEIGNQKLHGLAVNLKEMKDVIEDSKDAYNAAKTYLLSIKPKIDHQSYNILKLFARQSLYGIVFSSLYYYGEQFSKDSLLEVFKTQFFPFTKLRDSFWRNDFDFSANKETITSIHPNWIEDCYRYSLFFNYYECSRFFDQLENGKIESIYTFMKSQNVYPECSYIEKCFRGNIRERLLVCELLKHPRANDLNSSFVAAMKYVKTPIMRKTLKEFCMQGPGTVAQDFSLMDTAGRRWGLKDFHGKVVVLDFWFTGCGNCVALTPKLRIVEEKFKDNPDVVFVSVSSDVDRKMWINSVKSGRYTTSDREINLYTNGAGIEHHYLKSINFQGAPTLRLITKDGRWGVNPVDCRADDGKDLIEEINEALLAESSDINKE
jgi:thiol-disulfide isomerase/thioredoxin